MPDMSMPSSDNALLQMRQASAARAMSAGTKAFGANGKVDLTAIRKTAKDFEATFATEMMTHMFEGVGKNDTFGGGHGEEAFRSLLVEQYGKAIASSGQLGIADKVAAAMIKIQEGAR